MNEFEKMLGKKKIEMDQLEVPEELESRLYSALEKRRVPRRLINKWQVKAVALMLAILLIGYHGDTLAFYCKQLIGYDQIMNGTLKQLNQLGKGQAIEKSYTFKNGVTVTLDGIMLDDNQLLVFYTMKDPGGDVDKIDINPSMAIKGIINRYDMNGGQGEMNERKTEIKWIVGFETPYFYEKKLTWTFGLMEEGHRETGKITFALDRNKAMGSTLKKQLHKKITVDETTINFKSITASPTITSVKGEIQNSLELAIDQLSGERFRPQSLDIRLIANGKELSELSGGIRTDMQGIQFHKEFDALPADLRQLQIKLVSFGADHDVHQQVKLEKKGGKKEVEIFGQKIEIDNVYVSQGETCVTITTEESVVLSRVYLITDGKSIELKQTNSNKEDKKSDRTIMHTRTLHFPGTGRDLQLDIQRMKYNKVYNQVIDISID